MGENDKTILIVILAFLALFGCLVISCCAAWFFAVSRIDKDSMRELLKNSYTTEEEVIREIPAELTIDPETGELPEIEELIIQVTESTRELSALEKLSPVNKTEEELREYMTEQMAEVTDEDLAEELGLYNLLGFAPKDFDLRQLYVDLYTEQIAGFFDPEENQMFLIEDSSPYENALTLAHEYTHYLQYNNNIFSDVLNYDDDFCEENGETCIIIDALVEGDASLTENLIDAETLLEKYQTQSTASDSDSSVFDEAPKYFQESLLFPYVYGFDFVAYHYLKGGFDAVNDLYLQLPQSVEQIMHPEKYLTDLPVTVTPEPFLSIIGRDFDILRDDVLNESDILMILTCGYENSWQLGERQAITAAEGWGGGSYIHAEKDGKRLFFSKTVWDTQNDAEEAETVFALYSDRRFGQQTDKNVWKSEDGSEVYMIRQDDILYWMILPDNFEAGELISLIKNGSAL